jgi:hypothetical protein
VDTDNDSVNGDDNDDSEYLETNIEDLEITGIEAQVVANNLKVHKRIAKKGAPTTVFKAGNLVTLKIPPKMRLVGELLRLLARVIRLVRSGAQYKLMSRHGELKGLFPIAKLNPTDPSAKTTLGSGISVQRATKGQKPVIITLSKAVQAENQRRTVVSTSRAGRKRTVGALFDTNGNVDSANIVPGKRRRTAKALDYMEFGDFQWF